MKKTLLAALCATAAATAFAADNTEQLRKELQDAQNEVAQLKAELAKAGADANHIASTAAANKAAPAGVYIPENLTKKDIKQDDGGYEFEVNGKIENGNVAELAAAAKKVMVDAGFTMVKESVDKDDEAKLVYEKKSADGKARETIEVEIDKSWLSDKVEYDLEWERH